MGPLSGYKVIELAGIGPGPFCGMMLADMGAEVIRVDRVGGSPATVGGHNILFRNRRNIAVNLKSPEGIETILKLCEGADAIFEGYRPGVTDRLGVGPEQCMARNPKLVYGRMTGWGQTGPLSQAAGHDINYISISGALHGIGRANERPVPPLNLVGDFGGGGMMMAYGIVCALLEAQKSGKGQEIDCSMHEGSAALMAMFYSMIGNKMWVDERGANLLDGSSHFYDTYETKDGKYVSIGSIEPQFYALLIEKTGVDKKEFANQFNQPKWPEFKASLTEAFLQKTRDEWCDIMEATDVCFAPVMNLAEAPDHPHNKARNSFVEVDGIQQPAPTPRFSRTPSDTPKSMGKVGEDTDAILADCGLSADDIAALKSNGAVA